MKVKSDHRSKFSNLSKWKEEAWTYQGFNGIQIRDLHDTSAMLDQLSCEATHWERGQFVEFISSRAVKWCEIYIYENHICTEVVHIWAQVMFLKFSKSFLQQKVLYLISNLIFSEFSKFITGASQRLELVIKCCLFLSFFNISFPGPRFQLWQNRCHSNFTCSGVLLAWLNSYLPFWEKHEAMEGIQDKGQGLLTLWGKTLVPQSLREFTSSAKT